VALLYDNKIYNSYVECVKLLLENGAIVIEQALKNSCSYYIGNEVYKLLLEYKSKT